MWPVSAACQRVVGALPAWQAMVGPVHQMTFTRRLRGRMTAIRPGVLDAELRGRGTRFATRLVFADEDTFRGSGTLDFGHGNSIALRSAGDGTLTRSADGRLHHGTWILSIIGGEGRYAGASGRITSNFVLSPDGEVTDEQVVVLFMDKEE